MQSRLSRLVARRWFGVVAVTIIVLVTGPGCASVADRERPLSAAAPTLHPPATAPVDDARVQFEANGMLDFGALLAVGALAVTLWAERRRRALAEGQARRYLTTMAHLDRRASMGGLAASLAHELHQPLGAILRNAEAAAMLLASGRFRSDELREIVDDIRKDDRRATEIIRRMRALLGNHDLQEELVDLNEVARETIDFIAADAAARCVRLEIDLQKMPAVVVGDRVHLQQVLLNVALNAMEAMRDAPVEQRRLIVATVTAGSHVDVVVKDSGSGIPREAMPQVFDPFFTTKQEGMGVGLSIARSIIEAHRGRILAENNADRGATVRVSLPLGRHGENAFSARHPASHAS